MARLLEDLEKQIEEVRARAQHKQLDDAKKKAQVEAERLAAQKRRNETTWLL